LALEAFCAILIKISTEKLKIAAKGLRLLHLRGFLMEKIQGVEIFYVF
jgi:hypothetical protein